MLLPYGSSFNYMQVAHDALPGFEQPAFDDSSWSVGTAPFGSSDVCGDTFATNWDTNSDILLRKVLAVPPGARNVVVHAKIDNDLIVYLNGRDVSGGVHQHENCPTRDDVGPFAVPDSFVNPGGPNLIAVRGVDRGGEAFADISVTASLDDPCLQPGVITGTSGNDTITGTPGDDVICAGAGDDVIRGGDGADTIYGQGGNDVIYGQSGNDSIYGDDGNDTLDGGSAGTRYPADRGRTPRHT